MPKIHEDARVLEHREVAQATYRMRLECPRIARAAGPGQFAMLQIREGIDPLLRRPFSFHRIFPQEGVIEILYRVVGRGTWLLSRCSEGSRLNLVGPLGNGFHLPREKPRTVLLVAGGIGIAPIRELMAQLTALPLHRRPEAVHLFYGARNAAELLPRDFFPEPDISIHWSTDDGSQGYCGYVTQLLREEMEREPLNAALLYACGPLSMQYHVAQWALDHRVPAELSLESLMACGIGACLGCALPAVHPDAPLRDHYAHVCKDGPIFEPGAIQWNKIPLPQAPPPISLCS